MSESPQVQLDEIARSVSRRSEVMVGTMCCLFSSSINQRVGSGTTSSRRTGTIYWFVRQLTDFSFGVRSVDGRFLPMGEEAVIDSDTLVERYVPEIELFEEIMLPAVRENRFRLDGDDFAGFGYASNQISMDEANARSLFLLGLEYVETGRKQQAKEVINQLLQVRQGFPGKNQFLFNDFGIALRKAGFYSTAVTSYRKALEYTRRDDHLYYNLARAHYEQGQWWDCMNALGRCFEFNPELPVAQWLIDLIIALSKNTDLRNRYAKPPIPAGVARRAILLAEAVELTTPERAAMASHGLERRRIWHG